MICHAIEIFILIAIMIKLGMVGEVTLDVWRIIGLVLVVFMIIICEHAFYEVNYDRIREIIAEEIEKSRKETQT